MRCAILFFAVLRSPKPRNVANVSTKGFGLERVGGHVGAVSEAEFLKCVRALLSAEALEGFV
jgi:hypothetical protein